MISKTIGFFGVHYFQTNPNNKHMVERKLTYFLVVTYWGKLWYRYRYQASWNILGLLQSPVHPWGSLKMGRPDVWRNFKGMCQCMIWSKHSHWLIVPVREVPKVLCSASSSPFWTLDRTRFSSRVFCNIGRRRSGADQINLRHLGWSWWWTRCGSLMFLWDFWGMIRCFLLRKA